MRSLCHFIKIVCSGSCITCARHKCSPARCDLDLVLEAHHVRRMQETKSNTAVTPEQRKEFEQFWAHHADQPLRARDVIIRRFEHIRRTRPWFLYCFLS